MNEPADVIEFWFGDLTDTASTIAGRKSALWWGKNPATDAMIARRFGALVKTAATGRLDAWTATPEGRLALILVTDQFPRNIDHFGRFPHCNRILGRDSTPEEIEFLKQPGSSF